MLSLKDSIILIEETAAVYKAFTPFIFDRNLQSLIQLPDFDGVKAILIGRTELESGISQEILLQILKTKKELQHIPIMYDMDFGHPTPTITFPIGGRVSVNTKDKIITTL